MSNAGINPQVYDTPSRLSSAWSGYSHFQDKTTLPSNVLTYPTVNCFMPNADKIVNRNGSAVFGQEATDQFPVIGHYKKFDTLTGVEMEIRVTSDSGGDLAHFEFSRTLADGTVTWNPFATISLLSFPDVAGGRHVYFDEWWDNTAFKTRLVWAAKMAMSWSGGFGTIGTVTGNSLTLEGSPTWVSQGFDGIGIVVNGATYSVSSGNATATVVVTDATGISPGDFVADAILISPYDRPQDFHFCRTVQNHVIYGNFYTHLMNGSNALNYQSTATITRSNATLDDLIVSNAGSYVGTAQRVLRLQVSATGTPDTLTQFVDGAFFGTISAGTAWNYFGVTLQNSATTGHASGSFWEVTVTPAVTNGWGDFYQTAPVRKPGEAFTFFIPSNFWSMSVQEDVMYINDTRGNWTYLQLTLSADLTTETVSVTPLKQTGISKVIFPYMTGYLENDICYVTDQKNLDLIGRLTLVQLPQVAYLSDAVKLDFANASFVGGGFEFWDKKLWITSPADSLMFCWDDVRKYWQPPQSFPEAGILSLVGSSLIAHSDSRNQTNVLFVGWSDNGERYPLRVRTGYLSYSHVSRGKTSTSCGGEDPSRWDSKQSNMSFIEGYIAGAPTLTLTVEGFPAKRNNSTTHIVDPVISGIPLVDYVGGSNVGSMPIGGGFPEDTPYFQEIWVDKIINWYFIALDLQASLKDQQVGIMSLGVNGTFSNDGNNGLKRGNNSLLQNN